MPEDPLERGGSESRRRVGISHSFLPAAFCVLTAVLGTQRLPAWQGADYRHDIRKTEGGIPYISAGVGYDSRINLPRFSLMLIFCTKTQKYLADIDTEIVSRSLGNPIRIKSMGPWLHVDLPPGTYRIKARTSKGLEVGRVFSIESGRETRLKLVWDISDEDI